MNSKIFYRALVVDDEPIVRQATMRALSGEQFNCESATNGREASELVKQSHYDLVVSDLRMPEQNGHALAIELLTQSPRPIILVLTGGLEAALVEDLLSRGVDDVLFKPVDFHVFAKRALALVEMRRLTNQPDDSHLRVTAADSFAGATTQKTLAG